MSRRTLVATLILGTALLIGGLQLLLPITVSVLGTSVPCGPAVVAASTDATSYGTDSASQSLQPLCRAEGVSHTIAGLALAGVGALAFLGIMVFANPSKPGWPANAEAFRTDIKRFHDRAFDSNCGTCKVPWPCSTALAVLRSYEAG